MSAARAARAARPGIRPWTVPDVADAISPKPPSPPLPVVVAPPPPLPGWTDADLQAAREHGLAEGTQQAATADAARAARALEEIAGCLRAGAAAAAGIAHDAAQALADVLLQAVQAAFPALEQRLGPTETARLVGALLPGLAREPAICVRAAPACVALIAAELARLPDGERARVEVVADPSMGDADLLVTWRDGQAVREGAAIRAAVLAAIASLAETTGDDP